VAALTHALKKEWRKIFPDNLYNICTTATFGIKAVVQNDEGYIE